jgi:prolyl 4-hydroxylase
MRLPESANRLTDKIELWVIPNFATPEECQTIIDEANKKGFVISTVDDPKKHDMPEGRVVHQARTSTTSFPLAPDAPMLVKVGERANAIVGDYKLEGLQVQRYENTQKYDQHYDTFDNLDEEHQRNYTAMLYLNDIPEGGATLFSKIGIRVQPSKGTLVLWNNLLPNGCRNELTMHGGEPVTGTDPKYITTYWFRKKKGEICNNKENFVVVTNGSNNLFIGLTIGLLLLAILVGLIVFLATSPKKKPTCRK